MKLLNQYNSIHLLLISLIGAIFIVYPNIACFSWYLNRLEPSQHASYITFFFIRYIFIALLIWILLLFNLKWAINHVFTKRLISTFIIVGIAYLIYVSISVLGCSNGDCFTGTLLFQFLVVGIVNTFTGHMFWMYSDQRKKDQEIEQLKVENLQSRYNALVYQVNPHFFFNSLNGLTSLIRKDDKENTIAYVNKLSDVFRYILQSDKKGLVTLQEELEFVQALRYMMEVRFAKKLDISIKVEQEKLDLKIPVLSILPLIDNVVVHNTIDSEHKMTVTIELNERMELVISNPVFPKLTPPVTNGTGLKNLENRFTLLMDKNIKVDNDGKFFRVYLPLKEN